MSKRSLEEDLEEELRQHDEAAQKKTKLTKVEGPDGKDGDANPYWSIPGNRRVTVSDFRGKTYIGLREYYEKDGKLLPTKKGISLNLAQYKALLAKIASINAELRSKGIPISDPTSSDADGPSSKDDSKTPATTTSTTHKSKKNASKDNIEATSDEDEEEE